MRNKVGDIQVKRCSTCKKTKSVECFSRNKSSKDGYYYQCKSCRSVARKESEKRYRENNRERLIEIKRKSREKISNIEKEIPDYKVCFDCGENKKASEFYKRNKTLDGLYSYCKQCTNKRNEKYRKLNMDKTRIQKRKWKENNYEKYREMHKSWRKRNPKKVVAYKLRRRKNKANAEGFATAEQIKNRWELYGNKCYICGEVAEETDHVIPLSKGGFNWPSNLRHICKSCNCRKRATWPYKFPETAKGVSLVV